MPATFDAFFEQATGNPPFPWQISLYDKFVAGEFPSSANIPTGLGKTSIVAIWLIALALHPDRTPRRLVYVVNRRTVVDQTSAEVVRLRDALAKPELAEIRDKLADLCALPPPTPDAPPLAISTLRGQFADNGKWCADPSRPAVVVGTVDMIGSGLLFSRYTRGFKTRPLQAGFLAQDALLVHDEAHLEPAFQKLLERIITAQNAACDARQLRIIELTATSRTGDKNSTPPFTLTAADRENGVVQRRYNAVKRLSFVELDDDKPDAKLAALAKEKSGERAVLVFARTVEAAVEIAAELDKGERKGTVATLTGTMRGEERDDLVATNPVFQRFLPQSNRAADVPPVVGTVFLVATSAGEVGVNLSADDLVCDLSTYESMAQRFGRVNRFGERDDSTITVIHETAFDTENQKTGAIESARARTLALLKKLPESASPAALDTLPSDERAAAFSPEPEQRVATDIQFDVWALTSIRKPIAARPPVAPYLHGEAEWQPPETHIAWRDDLDFRHITTPEDFLEKFPLHPRELLRDTTKRIVATLEKLLGGKTDLPAAWRIAADGSVSSFPLSDFDKDAAENALADATLILPVSLGGLENGLLSGKGNASDVSGIERRESSTREDADLALDIADEDADEPRHLLWFSPQSESNGGVRPKRHTAAETLAAHTAAVEANASAIAEKLLPPDLGKLLVVSARLHDLGKNRAQWQRNLGNLAHDPTKPETILAKSAPGMSPRNVAEHYRHEFGSLNDATGDAGFATLNDTERDIVLHLVAAHHGRARPHFPADEIFDYAANGPALEAACVLAAEIPRRFARMQKRFGRWGLAWLESLLRAADYAASAGIVAQFNPSVSAQAPIPSQVGQSPHTPQLTPTATLAVNPANPGHYFACCGLFELATRLSPDALAWFSKDGSVFHIVGTDLSIKGLFDQIAAFQIRAVDPEDRPLTPLEISFTGFDAKPHTLRIDWWRHEGRLNGKLKPWAGQMSVRDIADDMRETLKQELAHHAPATLENFLFLSSTANNGEPFYFDANRAINAKAQDVGFSVDKLKKGSVKITSTAAPPVELLCLIGLQRARPLLAVNERGKEREYDYHLWHRALPLPLLAAAVAGLLPDSTCRFRFSNPSRAKDYRAFAPANSIP